MNGLRHSSVIALSLLALSLSGCVVPGRHGEPAVVVPAPPPPPKVVTVPPRPDHAHVWIPGHWKRAHNRWVWVDGRYARRPHPHARWIPGHWKKRRHGWVWIPGHWSRH